MPEQVINEEETLNNLLANYSQQDDPVEPTETKPIARSVMIHATDEVVGSTGKGKERRHTPTPEPVTNKEEAPVVDHEMQMELAGLKTLAKQGVVAHTFVNNPSAFVDRPLCTVPRILLQCYCN